RVEREVDVVAEQQLAGFRLAIEEDEPVAAGLCGREQVGVVRQIEGAAQKSHLGHGPGAYAFAFPRYARRGWRVELSSPPRAGRTGPGAARAGRGRGGPVRGGGPGRKGGLGRRGRPSRRRGVGRGGHSTSTSRRVAAASARSSASMFVSPTAIT